MYVVINHSSVGGWGGGRFDHYARCVRIWESVERPIVALLAYPGNTEELARFADSDIWRDFGHMIVSAAKSAAEEQNSIDSLNVIYKAFAHTEIAWARGQLGNAMCSSGCPAIIRASRIDWH